MRITDKQRTVITRVLHKHFGENARVLLFGSRVDDNARGGDIDLLIETETLAPNSERALIAKFSALSEIKRVIGDRKIDLIITRQPDNREIVRQAHASGVPL